MSLAAEPLQVIFLLNLLKPGATCLYQGFEEPRRKGPNAAICEYRVSKGDGSVVGPTGSQN